MRASRFAPLTLLATALASLVVVGVLFALFVHPAHAQDSSEPAKPTGLTGTTGSGGVPVYWLNGSLVANDYGDFYDGSWSNKRNARWQDGKPIIDDARDQVLCTGTNDNGTTSNLPLGGANPDHDGVSECSATTISTTSNTLSGITRDVTDTARYIALSFG